MKRHFLLLCLFILLAAIANAAVPYNQVWTKANKFYEQKYYDSAAYYYETLAAAKPGNPELYYNLGNTYYRLNRVGLSILNYKRALRLSPDYAYAKDNLELAQSRTSNKAIQPKDIFFISWWKNLTSPALSKIWAIGALVFFLILLGLFFRNRWRKTTSYTQQSILYTCSVLFLFMLIAAFVSAQNKSSHDEAVVLQSDAIFKSDLKITKSEILPEGTVVRCQETQGQWVSVHLADGREGWMRIESIEKI